MIFLGGGGGGGGKGGLRICAVHCSGIMHKCIKPLQCTDSKNSKK